MNTKEKGGLKAKYLHISKLTYLCVKHKVKEPLEVHGTGKIREIVVSFFNG